MLKIALDPPPLIRHPLPALPEMSPDVFVSQIIAVVHNYDLISCRGIFF